MVIWWIRRDLRLRDNQALSAALSSGEKVLPLFVIDPALRGSSRMGQSRLNFLWGGLNQLRRALRDREGVLVVRKGNPQRVLPELIRETGAVKVFAEEDYSPYARHRDGLLEEKVPLSLLPGLVVAHPQSISTADGGPYQIYSYYRKKWRKQNLPLDESELVTAPARIPSPQGVPSQPLPEHELSALMDDFPPGGDSARNRLSQFTSGQDAGIYAYEFHRNRPDLDGTSCLSPYFHFGMLSVRDAVVEALKARDRAPDEEGKASVDVWIDELIWRDFYISILYHFPRVLEESFRENLRGLAWENDTQEYQRWKEGRTGYPLVDAGMRQLLERGWMHNRLRMVVGSFLVKDLLIDWRWGEDWFMKNLVDADLAANNGGWQWVAGTGTDAAPYFRIFNPVSQSEKHDPQGVFIRRYLPVLKQVPDEYIHQPWNMPPEIQHESQCVIGEDYPQPIVDHSKARERALKAYREAREEE